VVKIADITSFITCPRLAYFRIHFGEDRPNEYHAAREIFLSLRKGLGYEWAYERFTTLYPDSVEIFKSAASKFKYSKDLERIEPLEWEIFFESEKLGLKGVVDEITKNREFMILMVKKSGDDFTFRERMRLAAVSLISGIESGFAYYAFDGMLRRYSINRRDRYNLLRLVEKLRRIEKGFMPERRETKKCAVCDYRTSCETEPTTFLSRFF